MPLLTPKYSSDLAGFSARHTLAALEIGSTRYGKAVIAA